MLRCDWIISASAECVHLACVLFAHVECLFGTFSTVSMQFLLFNAKHNVPLIHSASYSHLFIKLIQWGRWSCKLLYLLLQQIIVIFLIVCKYKRSHLSFLFFPFINVSFGKSAYSTWYRIPEVNYFDCSPFPINFDYISCCVYVCTCVRCAVIVHTGSTGCRCCCTENDKLM